MMQAFQISLIIFFVHFVFAPGGLFGGIGEYIDGPGSNRFEKFMAKPLFTCPVCMSPYYTAFVLQFVDGYGIPDIVYTIGLVGGINVILVSILDFLNSSHVRLEKDSE